MNPVNAMPTDHQQLAYWIYSTLAWLYKCDIKDLYVNNARGLSSVRWTVWYFLHRHCSYTHKSMSNMFGHPRQTIGYGVRQASVAIDYGMKEYVYVYSDLKKLFLV